MRWFPTRSILFIPLLAACSSSPEFPSEAPQDSPTQSPRPTVESSEQLGSVRLPVFCYKSAAPHIERGLALLHHMTYPEARAAFIAATNADPDCAIGYWGEAMTFIHPLWSDPPNQETFNRGKQLLQIAKERGEKTERENAYIYALEAYFSGTWSENEKPRLVRFADAWNEVRQQFPYDIEAAAIYALANLGTVNPGDKTYAKQKQSGAITQQLLQEVPDHPGGHHYTIHAYDYPPLAEKALMIAKNYGSIAPDVPHALHMPTHIFIREGLWQETIDSNIKSAKAALNNPANGTISLHYLHALDYLVYAYLQTGMDKKASEVLHTIQSINEPFQAHGASAYSLAAIPARIAIERQDWATAADIAPRAPQNYPWDKFPAMEAITYFARALGAARSGNTSQAQAAIDKLAMLKAQLPASAAYWATQIEIQRQSAIAWLQYQSGEKNKALTTMQRAAQLEASTEKHPITPGEVVSANELYADMLLALKRYDDALAQYEISLKRNPNRLNSLYSAGFAAEAKERTKEAITYYQQLVNVTAHADTDLPPIDHAKSYLNKMGAL